MQSFTDGSRHLDHAHSPRNQETTKQRNKGLSLAAILGVAATELSIFGGLLLVIGGLGLFVISIAGCGYANPRTVVRAGPVYLEDSKDNDILLEGAEYNHQTGDLHIDKFTLRNNASDVRIANVEQLRLVNEQIRIHGENITQSLGLITALAEKALPGLKINGPLGGSATASNSAVAILAEQVAALLAAKQAGGTRLPGEGNALEAHTTTAEPIITIPASVPAIQQ